jgi:hypothetical protein
MAKSRIVAGTVTDQTASHLLGRGQMGHVARVLEADNQLAYAAIKGDEVRH